MNDKMSEEPEPVQDEGAEISALELEENRIQVLGFFVADHAATENGKLYVNGGCFSTIFAHSFPANHPSIGLAAIVHIPWRGVSARSHIPDHANEPRKSRAGFQGRGSVPCGSLS